jgi:hypothetical protein
MIEKERQRIRDVLDEEMPVRFMEHDLETREKYKADRQ